MTSKTSYPQEIFRARFPFGGVIHRGDGPTFLGGQTAPLWITPFLLIYKAAVPSWLWRGCPVATLKFSFPAPAVLCGSQAGRLGKANSRRCLRRNLPFLPGPWQVFMKYFINEFGDDPKYIAFLICIPNFLEAVMTRGFREAPKGENSGGFSANQRKILPGCCQVRHSGSSMDPENLIG